MTITELAKELGVSRSLIYKRMKDAELVPASSAVQSTNDARAKELPAEVVQQVRALFADRKRDSSAEDPSKEVWSLRAENERLRADVAALHSDVAKLKHDIELRDIQIKHHNTSFESKTKEVEQLQAELDEQKQLVKLHSLSIANLSQSLRAALPAPAPAEDPGEPDVEIDADGHDEPDEDLDPDNEYEPDDDYTLKTRVGTRPNAIKRAIKAMFEKLNR